MQWLFPAIARFPRSQKLLLTDRIQSIALDILESLVEVTYTREKKAHLTRANLGIEKMRFLFRLAVELRYIDTKRYEHAARTMDDVGRLGEVERSRRRVKHGRDSRAKRGWLRDGCAPFAI
jgi:hypothetical protein